jgi:hypothetical protein
VRRDWLKAKGWLAAVMSGEPLDSTPS